MTAEPELGLVVVGGSWQTGSMYVQPVSIWFWDWRWYWSSNLFQQIKTLIRSWQKFYENSIHPNLLIIFSPEFQSLLLWKWWCWCDVPQHIPSTQTWQIKFSCDEGVFIQTLEEWAILLRNWFIVPIMTTRNLNQFNSLSAIFSPNNIGRYQTVRPTLAGEAPRSLVRC